MPNVLFDIPNPPSNTIILDETRKGRVQFTVNNVSGRPLMRVAARLTPMPDAAAAYGKWLKLDPDGFREFKIADSLQYAALIDVPAAGAAGNYAFRLDVWDDANPDDTLVNGPSITFTVPAPPVKPPATFPWWIPVVIVAVIVLIVGIVLITRPGPAPVITPTATATATATQTSTPTPPPTITPTPPPAIGNFGGHWNLAGASQTAGASADLQQNGINVVGTYFNGTIAGSISGFISGNTLTGQYRTQFGGGVFTWVLTNNTTQFQGTWDTNNDWCGFRNGSVQPVPCHPSLIIRIPIDIRDKVLKITLVAPSP